MSIWKERSITSTKPPMLNLAIEAVDVTVRSPIPTAVASMPLKIAVPSTAIVPAILTVVAINPPTLNAVVTATPTKLAEPEMLMVVALSPPTVRAVVTVTPVNVASAAKNFAIEAVAVMLRFAMDIAVVTASPVKLAEPATLIVLRTLSAPTLNAVVAANIPTDIVVITQAPAVMPVVMVIPVNVAMDVATLPMEAVAVMTRLAIDIAVVSAIPVKFAEPAILTVVSINPCARMVVADMDVGANMGVLITAALMVVPIFIAPVTPKIPTLMLVATKAPTVSAVVTTIPVALSDVTVNGPVFTVPIVQVVPTTRAVVIVSADTVTA